MVYTIADNIVVFLLFRLEFIVRDFAVCVCIDDGAKRHRVKVLSQRSPTEWLTLVVHVCAFNDDQRARSISNYIIF